jgi:PIN domain nuclease of toxin-antitoxin system
LLLDTHVWLWLINGMRSRASSRAWRVISDAARGGGVRVAVMSVWETAMLEAKGRVRLLPDCHAWVEHALQAPGIHLVELTPAISIASTRLPNYTHRDPVDRILIATARLTGATLVTRDRLILDYAKAGHLRALDASPAHE